MTRYFSISTILLVFLALSPNGETWAQVEASGDGAKLDDLVGEPIRVVTVGGGNFQGTLIAVRDDRIEILIADGQILLISREAIETYRRIISDTGDRAFFQDSASNRLMVMPTAFAMEPGEFHVTDQELIVVSSSYGLTENITFWGGISFPGALLSARFTSNFGDSLALSAGSFAGTQWIGPTSMGFSGILMPYVLSSWGEPDNNLTLGAGVPFAFGFFGTDNPTGVIGAIGGKTVLTSNAALVTENWAIWGRRFDFNPNNTGTTTEEWDPIPLAAALGLAFRIADSRFSWDIGAILPLSIDSSGVRGALGGAFIPVPLISLTFRIQ